MRRALISGILAIALVAGCSSATPSASPADEGPNAGQGADGDSAAGADASPIAPAPTPDTSVDGEEPDPPALEAEPVPVPFVPGGRPGSAVDYDAMVGRLEQLVPANLRNDVPWPDLRDPDPVVAQTEIFDFWIWMAANLTEPQLVEVMSAPNSPSRDTVVGVFGRLQRENVFEERNSQPYRAFDHRVITFESADLPLWLARDVPADAVVVYYSDNSGPVDIIDQESGALLAMEPGFPTRTWLAIMVPTDVGWQLWRDQLIDPSDDELRVPDVPPPPGDPEDTRKPEV